MRRARRGRPTIVSGIDKGGTGKAPLCDRSNVTILAQSNTSLRQAKIIRLTSITFMMTWRKSRQARLMSKNRTVQP